MEDWVGVIGLNLLNVLSLRHHTLKVNVCNSGPYSGHEINLRIVYILSVVPGYSVYCLFNVDYRSLLHLQQFNYPCTYIFTRFW